MRNITGIVVLIISTALALAGCHRPSARPSAEQAAPASQAEETQSALELPAPVTPAPESQTEEAAEVAELTAVGAACGGVICSPGLHCCNPSCNICTPKGVECTQQSCN